MFGKRGAVAGSVVGVKAAELLEGLTFLGVSSSGHTMVAGIIIIASSQDQKWSRL
ncbi:hypothetical protein ACLK2A_01815 [Escherichia coli]